MLRCRAGADVPSVWATLRSRARGRAWTLRWRAGGCASTFAALLLSSGCLVDSDHRCGDNQRLVDGLCLCAESYVLQAGRCVATGTREQPEGGLGAACTPGSQACDDPTFSLCVTAPSGRSYCTATGCQNNTECGAGFVCNKSGSPSYCRRFYEGQEEKCTSTADCARFDAKYCVVQLGMCIVRDCLPDSCDPEWTCFDLSQILPGEPKVCAPTELVPK